MFSLCVFRVPTYRVRKRPMSAPIEACVCPQTVSVRATTPMETRTVRPTGMAIQGNAETVGE